MKFTVPVPGKNVPEIVMFPETSIVFEPKVSVAPLNTVKLLTAEGAVTTTGWFEKQVEEGITTFTFEGAAVETEYDEGPLYINQLDATFQSVDCPCQT
jgi:hypothetical protein